jgi:hypothetical protein
MMRVQFREVRHAKSVSATDIVIDMEARDVVDPPFLMYMKSLLGTPVQGNREARSFPYKP